VFRIKILIRRKKLRKFSKELEKHMMSCQIRIREKFMIDMAKRVYKVRILQMIHTYL